MANSMYAEYDPTRGWEHFRDPWEIQKDDESGRFKSDDEARVAHRTECGCDWPEADELDTLRAWIDSAETEFKNLDKADSLKVHIRAIRAVFALMWDGSPSNVKTHLGLIKVLSENGVHIARNEGRNSKAMEGIERTIVRIQKLFDEGKDWWFGQPEDEGRDCPFCFKWRAHKNFPKEATMCKQCQKEAQG